MTTLLNAYYNRHDPLTARPIRVAIVASLLVHAALILELPQLRPPLFDLSDRKESENRLTVRLAPPPSASPAPSLAPRIRLRPPPPVVALEQPAAPPTAPLAATPTPPVVAGDLSAYIESRRRDRSELAESRGRDASSEPPYEDELSRANRIVAANLATQRQITFGYDPSRSGGVFQIERIGYDYAEFTFFGWNQDMRRRVKQLIEVQKGGDGDIRIAVIRKMIAIIRGYEPVEFTWASQRLGRSITLSSRMRDNAELEEFMIQEFFTAPRP